MLSRSIFPVFKITLMVVSISLLGPTSLRAENLSCAAKIQHFLEEMLFPDSAAKRKALLLFPGMDKEYADPEIFAALRDLRKHDSLIDSDASFEKKLRVFLDFEKIAQSKPSHIMPAKVPSPELLKSVDAWIRSEDHALFLYQNIDKFGARGPAVLEHLLANNECFSGAIPLQNVSPGALLTFSFEKETHNPVVTDYYKVEGYTDEAWFLLSETQREDVLRGVLKSKPGWFKKQLAVQDTVMKPSYLGKVNAELPMRNYNQTTRNEGLAPLEIRHKSYEFDIDRALSHVEKMQKKIGETDAFHFHEVFELPKEYAHDRRFIRWVKQLNDYLYLTGLEEGLHGTQLTKIPLEGELPKHVVEISDSGSKFYSAGLRGFIYGHAKSNCCVKIGIELRDVTRNFTKLKSITKDLAKGIQIRIWEQDHSMLLDAGSGLNPLQPEALKQMSAVMQKAGLSDMEARAFLDLEPKTTLPLISLDQILPADQIRPLADQARLDNARAEYLEGLRKVALEIADKKKAGETLDPDLVRMALRLTMTEWAQKARLSEFYKVGLFK